MISSLSLESDLRKFYKNRPGTHAIVPDVRQHDKIWLLIMVELHRAVSSGTVQNATTCLNCTNVATPKDCRSHVQCIHGEVCYTESILENGSTRYRMGCVHQTSCSNITRSATPIGKRWLLSPDYDSAVYCGRCCTGASSNCNGEMCTHTPLSPDITEMSLVNPPPRTSVCTDVSPVSCRLLGQHNASFCLEPHVRHVACREFCGTCNTSTSSYLHMQDCFYESTLYGGRVSTTVNNRTCRDWTDFMKLNGTMPSNATHAHASMLNAGNSCRDPEDKGHPWCYVSQATDLGWEYCNVRYCQECYYPAQSSQYTGYISDINGTGTCQMWSDLDGRVLSLTDSHFPEGSITKARNYCRDPLSIGYVYCFSNDALVRCNIPQCTGQCKDDPDTDCDILSAAAEICTDYYFSVILCAKTCGKCGFGLFPPTYRNPPTDSHPMSTQLPQSTMSVPATQSTANMHVTSTHTSVYTSPWKPEFTPVTSNTNQCKDDSRFDCHAAGLTSVICDDPDLAIYCNKTCNRCTECLDSPDVNCASPAIRTVVCPVDEYARGFCRKTCGKCDLPAVNINQTRCTDPTGKTDMCPFFNQEICICDDPELRPVICPYYCAGHCGPVVFGTDCGHDDTTTTVIP